MHTRHEGLFKFLTQLKTQSDATRR